jgi:hypothetical protein
MTFALFSFPVAAQQQGQQSGQHQAQAAEPQEPMGFFVTSTIPQTGNLGGLDGADRICQDLAAAAGAGDRTWRAYLSTQATNGRPAVNARDRIGNGPWHNAKGVLIAANLADLHGDDQRDRNNLFKRHCYLVNGRGDEPNQHDILTGSDSHGRAFPAGEDRTCQNWTSDSPDARGWVGHHDRQGGGNTSWNHVHATRGGCHGEGLAETGGNGRFYCFAAD